MTIKALIFDVDGTLSETEEVHRTAFNKTFAQAGIDWNWSQDTYRRLLKVTGGKERMRAYSTETGFALEDSEIAELHLRKTRRYGEMLGKGAISLRPGVVALVEQARNRRLRLAVATTTNRPNVDMLVRATWGVAADDLFDVIAAGDEVAAKKPAPDVYLLALQRLGIAADQALAFEDSRNGVLSARAAGLRVVATPSIYTRDDDLSGAELIIPDLSAFALEVPALG